MAIGDFCRSDRDCNADTFFDTGLVCVNGQCREAVSGGGLPETTPTPTPTVTQSTTGECDIISQNCPAGFICQVVESGGSGLGFFAVPTFTTRCVPAPTPPAATCLSYKIQSTEAVLTQLGNGIVNPTVSVRYTACGQFPESPVVTLSRTGIPVGNSIEYAATICSTTTPVVFNSGVTVSPPSTNIALCTQPPPVEQTTLTVQSDTGGTVKINGATVTQPQTGTKSRIVTVTAEPSSTRYKFSYWVIRNSNQVEPLPQRPTSTTLDIVMDVDKTVQAVFELVNQPPIANFTFTVNNQTKTVNFTDTSTDSDGTIASRRWNFGDSTTSNLERPTKTYTTYGSYQVQLIVTDDKGLEASVTKTVSLTQSNLTISATPKILRLRKNSNVSTNITIAQANLTSAITLQVANLPPGVTSSIQNQTATGATLRFSNSGQTRGNTDVTVTARGETIDGTPITSIPETVTIKGTYTTTVVPSLSSHGTVGGFTALTPTPTLLANGAIELEADNDAPTTITATAANGYRFVGFFKNPDLNTRVSQEGQTTLVISDFTNNTYTAKFEQIQSGQCTPPEYERFVDVSCPQGQTGTAKQKQVRTYNSQAPGPGTCPVTSDWQNSGNPDYTTCTTIQRWRNCITGQLVDGTPPTGYIQATFTGPAGGVCWEPPGEIGFLPSLSEALRFTYQRGSSTYPAPRTLQISNTSNSYAQRVTLTTDNRVNFTQGTSTSAGTVAVVIPPKGYVTLTVSVTPQLLQDSQDGSSVLALNVQYQRVTP